MVAALKLWYSGLLILEGKTVMNFKSKGNVVGCEFAGVVVQLGPNVDGEQVQVGQRVAGFVHGCES